MRAYACAVLIALLSFGGLSFSLPRPIEGSGPTCDRELYDLAELLDRSFLRVYIDVASILGSSVTTTPPPGHPTNPGSTTPASTSNATSTTPPPPVIVAAVVHSVPSSTDLLDPHASSKRSTDSVTAANLNLRSLYEQLAKANGVIKSDTEFNLFVSLMSKVGDEYYKSCYGTNSQRSSLSDATLLLAEFRSLRSSASLDSLHRLRAIFGKLLCLRDRGRSRGKRQSSTDLDDLFDGLSDKDLLPVFGFKELNNNSSPAASLAFAVDTTGSMLDEIDSVRELIRNFVASERSEPFVYVLAPFNDHGYSGVCDMEIGKGIYAVQHSQLWGILVLN